jgi:hypothetical protein
MLDSRTEHVFLENGKVMLFSRTFTLVSQSARCHNLQYQNVTILRLRVNICIARCFQSKVRKILDYNFRTELSLSHAILHYHIHTIHQETLQIYSLSSFLTRNVRCYHNAIPEPRAVWELRCSRQPSLHLIRQ